jgi:glutaconate CoA-transferase subunit B
LKGDGPVAVVTNRCVFRFDAKTKEMFLSEIFPGVTTEEIRDCVGWDLKIASDLKETPPPLDEETALMRSIDPMGILLGSKSKIEGESFDDYFTALKTAYESTYI